MFGFVTANMQELTQEQKARYGAVYCGICKRIRSQSSQLARMSLSYDMTFLALLLMSLYEPEETGGDRACLLHPIKKSPWIDNEYIRYSADMNVALAYYSCLDDWKDDHSLSGRAMASILKPHFTKIQERYPRQCGTICRCIDELAALEKENCSNPDLPAACFGQLMAEILVCKEDFWAGHLRELGMALGRFIYLADAMVDYGSDQRKHKYNPFLAMGTGEDWQRWEEYLILTLGKTTESFEKLPLVQDKPLLDNILYSGVWTNFRKEAGGNT